MDDVGVLQRLHIRKPTATKFLASVGNVYIVYQFIKLYYCYHSSVFLWSLLWSFFINTEDVLGPYLLRPRHTSRHDRPTVKCICSSLEGRHTVDRERGQSWTYLLYFVMTRRLKKLCYRRRTARRDASVEILPTAAWQCRNKLYNKSKTNRSNGVRALQSTNV